MNHKELIKAVSEETGESQVLTEKIINTMVKVLAEKVNANEIVRISDLGTFKKVTRQARMGVNPSTKAKISIPAKDVCKFKPMDSIIKGE